MEGPPTDRGACPEIPAPRIQIADFIHCGTESHTESALPVSSIRLERLSFRDHLEKSYNIEIQQESVQETKQIKERLKLYPDLDYEFVKIEGEGETAALIEV